MPPEIVSHGNQSFLKRLTVVNAFVRVYLLLLSDFGGFGGGGGGDQLLFPSSLLVFGDDGFCGRLGGDGAFSFAIFNLHIFTNKN